MKDKESDVEGQRKREERESDIECVCERKRGIERERKRLSRR